MTTWIGDPNDDCFLKTDDGYQAHVEAMDEGKDEHWCCIVTHGDTGSPPFNGRYLHHSAENGTWPRTGKAARDLCENVIDADRRRKKRERRDRHPH